MVSPFGRGFDSLQLHMQKKDHLKAAFLSYVEHVSFFYFASRKRSILSLSGPPGPRSPKGYFLWSWRESGNLILVHFIHFEDGGVDGTVMEFANGLPFHDTIFY